MKFQKSDKVVFWGNHFLSNADLKVEIGFLVWPGWASKKPIFSHGFLRSKVKKNLFFQNKKIWVAFFPWRNTNQVFELESEMVQPDFVRFYMKWLVSQGIYLQILFIFPCGLDLKSSKSQQKAKFKNH